MGVTVEGEAKLVAMAKAIMMQAAAMSKATAMGLKEGMKGVEGGNPPMVKAIMVQLVMAKYGVSLYILL